MVWLINKQCWFDVFKVFVYTVKALLIILPKRSLIESRQCRQKRKVKKKKTA